VPTPVRSTGGTGRAGHERVTSTTTSSERSAGTARPRLRPAHELDRLPLADADAEPPAGLPRGGALRSLAAASLDGLPELQERLYAEGRRSLLVVLQARDAGGKDGTIRAVFGGCNPIGVQVTSFGAPSALERRHDFLWRVHQAVPATGMIGIFNRSHYEAVLVERVRELTPESVWSKRYAQIVDFERLLAESGTTVLKFFLHVSREEQHARFRKRLQKADKHWKFSAGDLDDSALWDEYTRAYDDALRRTSTEHAPWYVVPADHKPSRNLLVAEVVVDTLARMDPRYPDADVDTSALLERLKKM
jgi:PPK2 family polyphosphate:nucleotide phosphotransferase